MDTTLGDLKENHGEVNHSCGEYMVTLTLNPSLYHLPIENQAKTMKRIIDDYFPDKKSVVLELTQQFNIHTHFYYKSYHTEQIVRHIYKCQKRDTALGRSFKVKPLFDKSGFIKYIVKALDQTQEFVHPVLYDDYNLIGKRDEILYKLKVIEWQEKHEQYEMHINRKLFEIKELANELDIDLSDIVTSQIKKNDTSFFDFGLE